MLRLVVLVSLVQLPPDPAALPPRMSLITQARTVEQEQRATYRAFLQVPAAERRSRFGRLSADDRSAVMQQHLRRIVDSHRLTFGEHRAVVEMQRAAAPAAYAGDASAARLLEAAETRLKAVLSEKPLAAFLELLPPPDRAAGKTISRDATAG
jgi:hypothetical protein